MRHWELPNDSLERYSSRRVVFARAFTLGKAPEVYPAGAYTVETKEQALEAGGHTAYVRASTVLLIKTATGTYFREIQSRELDEALLEDLEPSENSDDGNLNPEMLR